VVLPVVSDVHAHQGDPRLLAVPWVGPMVALGLLLLPAGVAVLAATLLASLAEPAVEAAATPAVLALGDLPYLLGVILVGDYGVVTMGPLLLVWALPTATVFALLQGAMQASGLLDRLTGAVHPLLRRVGLGGHDLVRVLMGFGCNVPAVVATRSCSTCTRDTTIHAIAFGSACSYQLGATWPCSRRSGVPA
jgi:ferrous iron transport protein B